MVLKDNTLSISAATVGGATLFGLVEYYSQGSAAISWKKTLTYAAFGGIAGFASSTAVAQANNWAQKSGGANWAVIGGSTGLAMMLGYSLYSKQFKQKVYSNKDLVKNSVIGMVLGGALGTAATYGEKSGLLFGRRTARIEYRARKNS